MEELFLKIIDNNVMYYVIVPLIIMFLGWMKSAYDKKLKNRELGYWLKKPEKIDTFMDIAMRMYTRLAIIALSAMIIRALVELFTNRILSYIVVGMIYNIFAILYICVVLGKPGTKRELLVNKKSKKVLLFGLHFIYCFSFLASGIHEIFDVAVLIFIVLLLVWSVLLYRYCDVIHVYRLDNSYADIYVKESEKVERAAAGTIKKKGEWIFVERSSKGNEEELRIKENDIVRIDYYGEPLIIVIENQFYKKQNREL